MLRAVCSFPWGFSFFGAFVSVLAVSVFGGAGFVGGGGTRRRGLRAVDPGRVRADLGGDVFASLSSAGFSVVSVVGVGSGLAGGGSAMVGPTEDTRVVPRLLPATSGLSSLVSGTALPLLN